MNLTSVYHVTLQVQNLTAAHVMKCDDDTFVRVDVVLRHIKMNSLGKPLYMGNLNLLHRPLRTGKWAVTEEVLSLKQSNIPQVKQLIIQCPYFGFRAIP